MIIYGFQKFHLLNIPSNLRDFLDGDRLEKNRILRQPALSRADFTSFVNTDAGALTGLVGGDPAPADQDGMRDDCRAGRR